MTELRHEIKINASADKVWKVLADLESVQYYNPSVKSAKYISQNKEGMGASRECELKPSGFAKERVIAVEPNKSMTIELYESSWPVTVMKWRTELAANAGATVVSQVLEYNPKGFVGAFLNILFMKRMINKSIASVFEGLKSYVENQK